MTIEAIENQIKTIPGNEAALESLYQLLDEKNAIAFVGAGASAGLWPWWNNCMHNFMNQGLKLGKISEEKAKYFKKEAGETPLETAQQLRNELEDRDYFDFLRTTFKDKSSPKTGGSFTLTHKALLQLPIHNYMTLNYDAGLTNARAALYPNATTSYFFFFFQAEDGIR